MVFSSLNVNIQVTVIVSLFKHEFVNAVTFY